MLPEADEHITLQRHEDDALLIAPDLQFQPPAQGAVASLGGHADFC